MKKLFAGLISLAAALFAVCAITVCAGAETSGDYEYSVLSDGTVEITDYKGDTTNLTIPATLGGKSVTSIGSRSFYGCSGLTSVTLPNSIVYIKLSSFEFCTNLKSIKLPNGVETIEYMAFSGCSSLTDLKLPNSVKDIGGSAFSGCSSLTSINLPENVESLGKQVFSYCTSLTSITVDSNNKYFVCDDGVLYDINKTRLLVCSTGISGHYDIPETVTSIDSNAFYGCKKLTSVNIPDSVTYIGQAAFYGTPFLNNQTTDVKYAGKWVIDCDEDVSKATIKSDTVGIAENAFSVCDFLTSITIPDSVKHIGSMAFSGCSKLSSITMPDNIISLGQYAFSGTPFYINKTSTVKYAGKWVIGCDEDAATAEIKSGTVGIADSAFLYHSNLTSIIIPNSVKYIEGFAFIGCSKLTSITIPDNVTNIGESTFYNCTSLTSITIPDSVTSIQSYAFDNCSSLKDIYYSGSKEQWDKITIDKYNDKLLNATIHYNYGKVPAPSSITGLKPKGRAADALRIAWTKNSSADGYIIEMKDGSKWVRVAKITKNSTVEYKKDKLKAGTAYTFRIRAYKMVGKTALYSGYTSISARTNPSAVSGLKLKGRLGDALRISWTKNTSADGYIIEMKSGITWTRVGKITKNSTVEFRKDKLKAGTAYSFRVKAYKMSGSTALYSGYTTISARTNPSAVSGLKLKNANSNAVRLAWSKNTSADGYIIEIKSGNSWTRVSKVAKNSTVEFRKGSLKSKTSYTFRVKAYKMSGKTALYSGYTTITVKTK